MRRAPALIALVALALALPAHALAQKASGALGVTAAVRAMTPASSLAQPPPLQAVDLPRPRDDAETLAAAAFRPGASPAKPEKDAPAIEVRAPDGYDDLGRFELKAAKIAYTRRF